MSETSKKRLIFWIRMVSWIGIGCVTPIVVFAVKFGLFKDSAIVYDELGNALPNVSYSFNGWGIVSCVLIGSFAASILKEVANAYSGYSLVKQCYIGICKTIPLIVVFVILYFIGDVIHQCTYCLMVLVVCRIISIPINPLPKWRYEKRGVEDYSTAVEYFTKIVKLRSSTEGGV